MKIRHAQTDHVFDMSPIKKYIKSLDLFGHSV
jgi:hypothetical protein